ATSSATSTTRASSTPLRRARFAAWWRPIRPSPASPRRTLRFTGPSYHVPMGLSSSVGSPPVVVRWGILSTARINDLVLTGAREPSRLEMVAVASRERARALEYAREHGLERAYGSYQELLEDPEIDAVYISLPNAFHVEWSIRALRAGKHVLCEKPLTRD